ncbi:zinc ABC transporter permease subunit ZnuB [Thorsellia anophelis]|uniref:High-affinity zinc uptake system membrane protein ZnuB n=1 Tax=Thorsellia anophelis DSM 18579 TaxID=1123402 RepID=A0A1I0CKA9_9GAMM|nr:zinc ABC transporter permease subunit ZnuB [Thorsellia anophelis]SET19888.1 zinc transport system permease protein [Thorsellia anophelis DSM 18579]
MFEIILPAWIAGCLLSFLTGPLGSFVVWRKMAYFGDTLAHASLLGVALGLFLQINAFYAVLATTLIIAILLYKLQKSPFLSIDTLLGIFAHSALSLGLVIVSIMPGVRVDLMNYLFGDLLAVTWDDLIIVSIGVVLGCTLLFWQWRTLIAMTVDSDIAHVEGYKIGQAKLLLILLTALVIGLAMKFVGALLITSLLIIPASTSRLFSKSPEQMALMAIGFSVLSVTLGLILSAIKDTPAGPSVVVASAFLFTFSLVIHHIKSKKIDA